LAIGCPLVGDKGKENLKEDLKSTIKGMHRKKIIGISRQKRKRK
jgi:hypothetical protein